MKPLNQLTPGDILELLKQIPPKVWIMIAAGGAGAAVFFAVIFTPAWVLRPQIKNQIKNIEGQMITTRGLLLKQPELIRNKDNFLKVSQEVKNRLYLPGEASLLLGAISRLAQESNVSVVASNPKKFEGKFPAPFDAQYEGNAYDFTVEGGYHELALFISKIENNSKVLRVQNYNIRPQEKTPNKHLAEISLSAVSTKSAGA